MPTPIPLVVTYDSNSKAVGFTESIHVSATTVSALNVSSQNALSAAGEQIPTLNSVTDKINNTKANAPEGAGHSRKDYKAPPKDWTKLSQSELRENWDDIVKDAVERSKANVKIQ